jgi:hypothetical protein
MRSGDRYGADGGVDPAAMRRASLRRFRAAALGLGLGLGVLCVTGPVAADEASHRRAAERLLEVAGSATLMSSTIDVLLEAQIRSTPQLAPFADVLRRFLDQYMSFEALKEELLALYVADFTEAELDELAAFYRTPTGAKAIARLPILMARGGQIGERRMRANQAELVRMIQEEQQRLGTGR